MGVQRVAIGKLNSLSRKEAEKIAESGSSAEESDGEGENTTQGENNNGTTTTTTTTTATKGEDISDAAPTSFYEEKEGPGRPGDPPSL